MRINVNLVTSTKEKNICFSIRREVFIVEQRIDEKVEMDDNNFESNSFIASINKTYVGTARCRSTKNGIKLERFAVLKPFRGSGVGKSLIMFMLRYLKKEKYILIA